MGRIENFRQYAADCVRQAEGETTPEDKNILLNMALAWVRLAKLQQSADTTLVPSDAPELPLLEPSQDAAEVALPER